MNFSYDPEEFAINMNMYMNNDVVFSNSFSGEHNSFIFKIIYFLAYSDIKV